MPDEAYHEGDFRDTEDFDAEDAAVSDLTPAQQTDAFDIEEMAKAIVKATGEPVVDPANEARERDKLLLDANDEYEKHPYLRAQMNTVELARMEEDFAVEEYGDELLLDAIDEYEKHHARLARRAADALNLAIASGHIEHPDEYSDFDLDDLDADDDWIFADVPPEAHFVLKEERAEIEKRQREREAIRKMAFLMRR